MKTRNLDIRALAATAGGQEKTWSITDQARFDNFTRNLGTPGDGRCGLQSMVRTDPGATFDEKTYTTTRIKCDIGGRQFIYNLNPAKQPRD